MTTVYFIRHAEPNFANHDDLTRELSQKGLADRRLVTVFLQDKGIGAVLSSPYRRAIDTVGEFAARRGLPVVTVGDFRERCVGSWVDDFDADARRQWEDFDYKLPGGESLREVETRCVTALERVLADYAGQRVAVGSHGTALSVLIHHYDASFGYREFNAIKGLMPWAVRFRFDGTRFMDVQAFDLFAAE